MAPSLSTTVAGIELKKCVYNASGPRTGSSAALVKISNSASGGVLAKSATVTSQNGNPLPRTWHDPSEKKVASLNSEGLPNAGIEYYLNPTTIEESMLDSGKPYMVSISGSTLEDNLKMLQMTCSAVESGAKIAALELNLACPNVIGKPIIAYDFRQMDEVLQAVCSLSCLQNVDLPLGVKMPPYFDGPHFDEAARIVNKYKGTVRYVATMNTIGNAFAVDPHSEMPVISSKGGFAGLSGPAVKYTALANVRKLRELLDPCIDVVGVGGIQTGTDAFEMILCGASAVQVGTCHWVEGPKCFDRIVDELRSIMSDKGYQSIDEFKGKLKPWSKEGAASSRSARKGKGTKDAAKTRDSRSMSCNEGQPFLIVSAILFAMVAALLADKFGVVQL